MAEAQLLQLLGLVIFSMAVGMLFNRAQAMALLEDFADHPAHSLVLSIGAITAGFLIVSYHSNWDGNWSAVAITVIGWIMLAKGMVSLLAAPLMVGLINWVGRHPWLMTVATLIATTVGGLLAAAGFGWI